MKFLPLFALLGLTGCQTTYTRMTITNFDGERVSQFIAEGGIRKTEQGYLIRAVERTVEGAHPVTRRFPNGWRTVVVGANILREEIDKPDWLVSLDAGEGYMSQETHEVSSVETLK
jgi:excinuclease UvrABC helicase subunit UvrB